MVVDGWIQRYLRGEGSYHDDYGEGLDDYKVGRSLGAGAMAPYVDGKLILNENFRTAEIVENGPLRTTFKLTYSDLIGDSKSYSESRTISIDAGSQLTKIVQEYGFEEPVPVAAGFPLHADNMEDKYQGTDRWLVLDEPATAKSSGVYLGLVFTEPVLAPVMNEYTVPEGEKNAGVYKHVLRELVYNPGEPLTYYTGYGWKEFGFEDSESFRRYLENFASALDAPFAVSYK